MTKEQVFGIIRHGLTFIGGVLVVKGIMTNGAIEELVSASITLLTVMWSVLSKRQTN